MEQLRWFLEPIEKHYFDFEGRATRQAFWMFVLWTIIISVVVSIIGSMAGMYHLSTIFNLAILLPSLGLGARRLHDTGMSGWWQVVGIIPFIGWLILVIMLAQQGKAGPNEYGEDPRAATGGSATAPVAPIPAAPTTPPAPPTAAPEVTQTETTATSPNPPEETRGA